MDGKTGWFPSNYVKDIAPPGIKHAMHNILTLINLVLSQEVKPNMGVGETAPELQTVNQNLIVKDILDSEKNYITEIQALMKSILTPLGNTDM